MHREGTPDQVCRSHLRNDYIAGETVTIEGGLAMRIA